MIVKPGIVYKLEDSNVSFVAIIEKHDGNKAYIRLLNTTNFILLPEKYEVEVEGDGKIIIQDLSAVTTGKTMKEV